MDVKWQDIVIFWLYVVDFIELAMSRKGTQTLGLSMSYGVSLDFG